jgi:hypothetical protein
VSGFDFTRADGRDANIVVISNIGVEDNIPHCKVNLVGSTASISFPAGVWKKLSFTATSSYTSNWTIGTDSITYQPINTRDVMMWISGAISTTSQQANFNVAIIKNHNTLVQYGTMPITVDQNARQFNFSTNAYIASVAPGDVFSIWIKPVGTEDLIIAALDWLVIAK